VSKKSGELARKKQNMIETEKNRNFAEFIDRESHHITLCTEKLMTGNYSIQRQLVLSTVWKLFPKIVNRPDFFSDSRLSPK
jgi:hypothetical protein